MPTVSAQCIHSLGLPSVTCHTEKQERTYHVSDIECREDREDLLECRQVIGVPTYAVVHQQHTPLASFLGPTQPSVACNTNPFPLGFSFVRVGRAFE